MNIPNWLAACLLTSVASAAERPNIVFILADDLGYTDVNTFANRITGVEKDKMYYETPNIDRLAAGGLAFSQAYAYQLCSPTRASLLTGKNAPALGVTTATTHNGRSYYSLNQSPPTGYKSQDARYWGDPIKTPQALLNGTTLLALGPEELTFAEALGSYHSAFIGKWHVGDHGSQGYQPEDQGFENLASLDAGASPFFKWRELWDKKTKNFPEMPQKELLAGKAGETTGEDYLTPYLTGEVKSPPHAELFFGLKSWGNTYLGSIRQGNWELILNDSTSPQLFDLSKDLGETHNLAANAPERVAALTQSWQKWHKQMPTISNIHKNTLKNSPEE